MYKNRKSATKWAERGLKNRCGREAYGQLCFKVTPYHIDWVVPALTRCDSRGKPLSKMRRQGREDVQLPITE